MLNESFLKRLETMRLRLRHPAAGGAGGLRRSKALGSSVEFSDFREYTVGDDLRRVDWNAYGRFEKLFLKLFMEEQEAQVRLLLDASGSMTFGEPSKWETAARLAEALCYLSLCGGDTVIVTALQAEGTVSTQPLTGRQGFVKASDFLQKIMPQGRTDLSAAITKTAFPAGRGISVLISDFLSPNGYETALKSLQYRTQEVAALQILCEQELNPALEDAVQLVDAETGETMEIMAGYDVLKAYRNTVDSFLEELRGFCHRNAMMCASLQAEADLERTLLRELSRIGLIT